jgi:hypothetical protein
MLSVNVAPKFSSNTMALLKQLLEVRKLLMREDSIFLPMANGLLLQNPTQGTRYARDTTTND